MTLRCLATRQQPFADFLVGTALSSYFSDGRFAAAVGYDNLTDFAAAVGHDKCNRLFCSLCVALGANYCSQGNISHCHRACQFCNMIT
jgi:hypothetical protein